MRSRITLAMTVLLGLACARVAAASPGLEFGLGMEYFSVAAYSRDLSGYYFQSLLQSTLAKARLGYTAGPVRLELQGGLSDWNVSGVWRGSDYPELSLDAYYTWAWQQEWQAEADWTFLPGLALAVAYDDHQLRHYNGNGQETFLQYRLDACDLGLQYAVLRTPSVQLRAAVFYAPRVALQWFSDPRLEVLPGEVLGRVDLAATGWRAQGRLQFEYRDSGGWGIDIGYLAGYARFPQPGDLSEITLRQGTLTGCFTFLF
jgi:hypothetical protein